MVVKAICAHENKLEASESASGSFEESINSLKSEWTDESSGMTTCA